MGVATSTTTDAIGALLKQCGYQVWVVYDGQEALSKAVVDLPEAVLLDIGIPSIDGIEGPASFGRRRAAVSESSRAPATRRRPYETNCAMLRLT